MKLHRATLHICIGLQSLSLLYIECIMRTLETMLLTTWSTSSAAGCPAGFAPAAGCALPPPPTFAAGFAANAAAAAGAAAAAFLTAATTVAPSASCFRSGGCSLSIFGAASRSTALTVPPSDLRCVHARITCSTGVSKCGL